MYGATAAAGEARTSSGCSVARKRDAAAWRIWWGVAATGGGGCRWRVGATETTMKRSSTRESTDLKLETKL
ncbi:hypothetical protein Syun_000886 [Stephania yunnanensis]|uniref:Uncharacterized protein n=1 Tax=Stephania yunnanensis TaxID=152371 RepID=A0AAP0QAC1_9MAGN